MLRYQFVGPSRSPQNKMVNRPASEQKETLETINRSAVCQDDIRKADARSSADSADSEMQVMKVSHVRPLVHCVEPAMSDDGRHVGVKVDCGVRRDGIQGRPQNGASQTSCA